MCGFTGYIGNNPNEKIIKEMADKIAHRGPDDEGYYLDDSIAMGFRRLSIIDLSGGHQPILNDDESLVLTFNGEIYNYKQLRDELIDKGYHFKTDSDSETILRGYEAYGVEILQKLRGMFAFVIWDKNKKELFGARDMFGIKPFYYTKGFDSFLYGSEIKSFLPHPHFKKSLNEEALENYLTFQYSVGNASFFSNVFKLEPSHYFIYRDGKMAIHKYFDRSLSPSVKNTGKKFIDEIDRIMDNSVKAHKISDVPVGSFLSSGIDSSYIATIAKVDKTFTVGFLNTEKYNEISYAKTLSKEIGVNNYDHNITAKEYWDSLRTVQYHMDEPLADASAVALYFVSKLARNHVKVALSGEGADELFGGYNIYREPYESTAYKKIPMPVRRALGKVAGILPNRKGINFIKRNGLSLEERFFGNATIFTEKERKSILNVSTNATSPTKIVAPFYKESRNHDAISKMQTVDINTWLIGDILLKADKMSMAHSLEVRVPFLDKEVFDVAKDIPTSEKLAEKTTKYALREAASRHIPDRASKKKKLGFPVPIRVWLRDEKYIKIIKEEFEKPVCKKYFNEKLLSKLFDEHISGKKDNSRKLWTIYTFLLWYSVFFNN